VRATVPQRAQTSTGWVDVVAGGRRPAHPPHAHRRTSLQRNVELSAVVWFVLVVVVDLSIPSTVIVIGLVNLSTLLVTAVSPVRRTAVFAVAAVVAVALCPLWDQGQTTSTEVVRVVNTVLFGAVAVGLTILRERRDRQVLRIVAAAEAAQRAVLPTLPAQAGRVGIAARYHSAADEAMVGGDVFDMYYNDTGKVIALVGDVAGHGLASVQEGARLIRAFRQYAPTSESLEQLGALMNAYITPFLAPDVFVTAVLADVSSTDTITVASCGHPAPLLLTATGLMQVPITYGPPLGLGSPTGVQTQAWCPGDRLLLHTDGLLEARDRSGRFLPPALVEPALRTGTPAEAVDTVIEVLEGYVPDGRLHDDVCLMVLENRGRPRENEHQETSGPAT
jgi:phosphoserine phosphatase RsbU/P